MVIQGRRGGPYGTQPRRAAAVAVLACAGMLTASCAAAGARAGGNAPPSSRPPGHRAASVAAPAATARPAVRHRGGQQLITVLAPAYADTYATLSAYRWSGSGWLRVLGPWPARIGRGGMARPGRKREGDGRTPSGTFGVPFLFGTGPDPGFRYRYRRSRPWIAWDDDPASRHYNEWVDTRYRDAGASPEPMDVSAYVYGAVIGYNTARIPGRGSAIFLHASIGIATAGCVTLPIPRLLRVLRWLDPRRSPHIRLGVG